MIINRYLVACVIAVLTACSTAPKEKQLLPDGGPTTSELIHGSTPVNSYYGNGRKAAYNGEALMPNYHSSSQFSSTHLEELKRDFKRVPNPEIIGYVYPHINANRMPVPGYFTTFTLYDRDHFALTSEGYND